jgi:hypothetical protein
VLILHALVVAARVIRPLLWRLMLLAPTTQRVRVEQSVRTIHYLFVSLFEYLLRPI